MLFFSAKISRINPQAAGGGPSTPGRTSSKDDYPLHSLSKRTSFSILDMAEREDDVGKESPTKARGGGRGYSRKGKKRLSDVDAADEEEGLLGRRIGREDGEDDAEYEEGVSSRAPLSSMAGR